MATSKKLTPKQQAYKKEVDRIKRTIRDAKRKGFFFPADIVPDMPKRVTAKALESVRGLRGDTLYKQGYIVSNPETGEVVQGDTWQKAWRKFRAQKAAITKRNKENPPPSEEPFKAHPGPAMQVYTKFPDLQSMAISRFIAEISHFPAKAEPILADWLSSAIFDYGENAVATMLEDARASGIVIDYQIAYDSTLLANFVADMLDFLPTIDRATREELIEAFESEEGWE